MGKKDESQFKKFAAKELPPAEAEKLRNILRHDLTEAMIRSIKANPPEIDLSEVEVVLGPDKKLDEFDAVKDCLTCVTCVTCDTCATCITCDTCATCITSIA
jgi:hypothetical protein